MAKTTASGSVPQGIDASHLEAKGWHRHANPASIFFLGLLMALAFAGVFGGQPHPTRVVDSRDARITLQLPERIRNGEFFEMRIIVETRRPFTDLTIAVSSDYWHDLTINTMIPAPTEETADDGRYHLNYGEIDAKKKLTIKIDGQINPPLFGGTKGEILLMDGKDLIATIPVKLTVFP